MSVKEIIDSINKEAEEDGRRHKEKLDRLLQLPVDRLDLGDGRTLLLQQWSPSVGSKGAMEVRVHIEGVIMLKKDD